LCEAFEVKEIFLWMGIGLGTVLLIALNGADSFHIRERNSGKPLVLIFGSFT